MDSFTQATLGAAVGVAVMGRRTALWKAALWGAACGTAPDLDVFIDHGDPVRNMVLHRAHSHALFWLTLLSPLPAALAVRLQGEGSFRRWWLALWLALVTHPLLDLMTVYGTQLARPFSDTPFAIGSVFIIDPLYTVPLVVGLAVALAGGTQGSGRACRVGLLLSTAYLAWGMGVQHYVKSLALASARLQGVQPQQVLVTPAPFSTVLWRVVMVDGTHYHEGFYSLLDRSDTVHLDRFDRGAALEPLLAQVPAAQRVRDFSRGFYRLSREGGQLVITDLRMGQEPGYVFSFAVAQQLAHAAVEPLTPQAVGGRVDTRRALAWLGPRMLGTPLPPPR